MKFYTSYFYAIRFMKPYQIPLSTAVWDPKWFHDFHNQSYTFIDKNGVVNGIRAEMLAPGPECSGDCAGPEGNVCDGDPRACVFQLKYKIQLNKIDFNDFLNRCKKLGEKIKNDLGFAEEPEFMLIVHEAPDNMCSERNPLQNWVRANGYEIKEFDWRS